MSLLLDALKKLEKERLRGSVPAASSLVVAQTDAAPAVRSQWLLVALLSVAVLMFAGVALYWWLASERGSERRQILVDRVETPSSAVSHQARVEPLPEAVAKANTELKVLPSPAVEPANKLEKALALDPQATGGQEALAEDQKGQVDAAVQVDSAAKVDAAAPATGVRPGSTTATPAALAQAQIQVLAPAKDSGVTRQGSVDSAQAKLESNAGDNALRVAYGDVLGIKDGCLLEVELDTGLTRVALAGVRCPAQASAFAGKARSLTTRMVFAQRARLVVKPALASGRADGAPLRADVYNEQNVFVNARLVEAGLAWGLSPLLKSVEVQARDRGMGMWGL